jgi:hypothetical protein
MINNTDFSKQPTNKTDKTMKKLFLIAVTLMLSTSLFAQTNPANITASAVIDAASGITGAVNLQFGTVITGAATTIAPTASGAGRFDIVGSNSSNLALTFTLPTQLDNGLENFPITFNATSAIFSEVNDSADPTAAVFDPNGVTNHDLSAGGLGFVFLGGTVNPPSAQATGTYTGTITLQVAVN